LSAQDYAQMEMKHGGRWIQNDSVTDQRAGVFIMARLMSHEAQKVMRIGMKRIDQENLSIERLRPRQVAALMVAYG